MSERVHIGVNLGFSFTSCATVSGASASGDVVPLGRSNAQRPDLPPCGLPTAVYCRATRTSTGIPAVKAQFGVAALSDVLPTLIGMSHDPTERINSVHPLCFKTRTADGTSPAAFLWQLFYPGAAVADGTPADNENLELLECCLMECAVFLYWILKHSIEVCTTRRYADGGGHPSEREKKLNVASIVVVLPHVAFSMCQGKTDGVVVALDAAMCVIQEQFFDSVQFRSHHVIPDTIASLASLPTDVLSRVACAQQHSTYAAVVHVGGCSSSFSFARLRGTEDGVPSVELLCSVSDTSSAGGDAVDHAIMHQILSLHQMEFISHPLTAEAKGLLLERIRLAKEQCCASRKPCVIEIVAGPAATNPDASYKLEVDFVEKVSTEILFRKLTKILQHAAVATLQSKGFSGTSSTAAAGGTALLNAMRSFRPELVILHGRSLHMNALRKRVESLCRTMGDAASASSSAITFYIDDGTASNAPRCGNVAFGAAQICALSATESKEELEARRALLQRYQQLPLMYHTEHGGGGSSRLAMDVVVHVHGGSWGVLASSGSALPLRAARKLEVLSGESSVVRGRFSSANTSTTLSAFIEICAVSETHVGEPVRIFSVDAPFAKLSATEGGVDRFSVIVEVTIADDGSVGLQATHIASGSTCRFDTVAAVHGLVQSRSA